MSNSAWCDLNSKCDTLKVHDIRDEMDKSVKNKFFLVLKNFNLKEQGLKIQRKNIQR